MKLFVVVILFFAFFDCSSKKTISENNMENFLSYSNKVGEVEYTFKAKLMKKGMNSGINYQNDTIQIEYELKNTGNKNYLVYDKGHFGSDNSKVYVEPQKDGIVEISQKAFSEPKDKDCPERYMAITPKATWLNAKENIKNQFELALPLQVKTPFDDCLPKAEMPKEVKSVKICIGIAEADTEKVSVNNEGVINGLEHIKAQQFLCSDLFKL